MKKKIVVVLFVLLFLNLAYSSSPTGKECPPCSSTCSEIIPESYCDESGTLHYSATSCTSTFCCINKCKGCGRVTRSEEKETWYSDGFIKIERPFITSICGNAFFIAPGCKDINCFAERCKRFCEEYGLNYIKIENVHKGSHNYCQVSSFEQGICGVKNCGSFTIDAYHGKCYCGTIKTNVILGKKSWSKIYKKIFKYKESSDISKKSYCKEDDCGCPTGCENHIIKCGNWGYCDRANCECEEEYCKGWCMSRVKYDKEKVPVWDGEEFASCGSSSIGNCNKFGEKYERSYYTYSEGSSCTCSFCTIKDFQECDDVFINDSHPCTSKTCSADFEGGRAFCCPKDMCAHLEANIPKCYPEGEHNIKGYKLLCMKGTWFFLPDNKEGGIEVNLELWKDKFNVYPEKGWGTFPKKKFKQIVLLNFDNYRDIIAYVINPYDKKVNITIKKCDDESDAYYLKCKIIKNGYDYIEAKNNAPGYYLVEFSADINQKNHLVKVIVDTFTSEGKETEKEFGEDCLPFSKGIKNFIEETDKNKYCCFDNNCYFNGNCYENLKLHKLSEDNHYWFCENGKFRKSGFLEKCVDSDFDCIPGYGCSEVFKRTEKVCCPIIKGERSCAILEGKGGCIDSGKFIVKDEKIYTCSNGKWVEGSNKVIKYNVRVLLAKNENYSFSFDIEKELRNAKIYFFSEKGKIKVEYLDKLGPIEYFVISEGEYGEINAGILDEGQLKFNITCLSDYCIFGGANIYGEP